MLQLHGVIFMKPLKEKLSITIDSDIVDEIRALADEDQRSLSQYINLVLRKHLENLKKMPEGRKQ